MDLTHIDQVKTLEPGDEINFDYTIDTDQENYVEIYRDLFQEQIGKSLNPEQSQKLLDYFRDRYGSLNLSMKAIIREIKNMAHKYVFRVEYQNRFYTPGGIIEPGEGILSLEYTSEGKLSYLSWME